MYTLVLSILAAVLMVAAFAINACRLGAKSDRAFEDA
jgi:hypothetical protein